MPEPVRLPYRLAYRSSFLATVLGVGRERVVRAMRTDQLPGRMTESGRYLAFGSGVQGWCDRGMPRMEGDPDRLDLRVVVADCPAPPRHAYRLDEAAALLDVSPAYLARQRADGQLRCRRLGSVVLVLPVDLVAWLESLSPIEYRFAWWPSPSNPAPIRRGRLGMMER